MKITDFDGITGEKTEREANPEEIAEIELLIKATQDEALALAKKVADREALLTKLGITAEEAALLLG